jgi:UDP-glucose 4-epimerase
MSKISSILVTGGAGFIGSYVTKLLLEKGYHTIVLDNLSKGKKEHLLGGEFIEGDLADRSLLNKIFKNKIEAVLHFAAFTDVGQSVSEPELYHENNVEKTRILLEEAKKQGVSRFIFSSSAAVYGNPLQDLITEDHPTSPINPYGATKLTIEKELGPDAVSLRYFNAAGGDPEGKLLYRHQRPTNLIPIILQGLMENRPFTLFGKDYPTPDGTCVRDYIHIHDLASAHVLALISKGGVYNLGNGRGYSVLEVVSAVEKITGIKVNLQQGPRRAGDPPYLVASSAKAKKELGWKPIYSSLEEMVEHAWKGYQQN